ncbi:MAG: hypothetical protein CME32_32590 [Gimesia sp.]|nr:hypothetical protein [Gimesia sp.]
MHAAPTVPVPAQHQQLLGKLTGILNDLEPIQKKLLELYEQKSQALKQVDPERIEQLAVIEEQLTNTLQFILLRRQQLLQTAEQLGLPASSLQELLPGLGLGIEVSEPIAERIEVVQQRSQKLRHESWVQWIVAQRSFQHYSQILELIAHAGKKTPTYSGGQNENGSGGAIFDASA